MVDNISGTYSLHQSIGTGKTTLLKHIAAFEIEGFPRHHRVLHVKQEVRSSGKTVLETVLQSDVEREALMEEEREILARQHQKDQDGGAGASGSYPDMSLTFPSSRSFSCLCARTFPIPSYNSSGRSGSGLEATQ